MPRFPLPSLRRPSVASPIALACLAGAIGALSPSAPLPAQDAPARVRGTVRAESGRPVADARITIGTREVVSDADGRFDIVAAPGASWLVARAVGFLPDSLALRGRDAARVALVLRPLAGLNVVEVVASRERPLLNTADATTGGSVERFEIERLPTDARDPIALAYTIPGVTTATAFFGDAPRLSINGANALYTQYALDGLENNEGFLGGPRVDLPLSALARLDVLANTYGASLGRSSNGIVNASTRAGGETWTGEFFAYNRPGLPVDARSAIVPAGQDPDDFRRAQEGFRRTQLGGAVGGPLAAGRSYVFAALEYTNENEDRIASTANATFTGREVRETLKGFARLDHGWSPTQVTTLRIAASGVAREGRGSGIVAPEADIVTERIGSATALVHRSTLRGGRASNTASLQLGTFRWNFPPAQSDFDTPQVTIRRVIGGDTTSVGVVGSSNFVFDEAETQWQFRNVFETDLGRTHRVRAGVDAFRSSFRLTGSQTNPAGSYVVLDEGNIPRDGVWYAYADIPADVRVLSYTVDAAQKQVDLTQSLVGAFIEDRWRLSPALTLTLGLRWDYDDLTARGASSPDLDNWQPRASVNWLATPNTVLRAGAGLYAGKFPYAVYSDAIQFGPDGNQTVTFAGDQTPAFGQGPRTATLDRSQLPPGEVRELFALGLEQPMSRQLSAGWQQQFGARLAVSVDGVYTDTRNLPRSWDLNANTRGIGPADTISLAVTTGDAFRPVTPVAGGFRRRTTTESGGRAWYAGLYTSARWRVADAWLVDGNWIWSRSRNNTEDINFNATVGNDFAAEWADAINDRRHRIAARATFTGVERLALAVIGDWQTGQPINRVAFFRDLDGSGDTFGNGFLGNQDRFSGVPRNGERLPSAFFLNASASYQLPFAGRGLELRADAFNLLNGVYPGGYANGLPGGGARTQVGRPGDPIVVSNVAPPRQLQFSARVLF